MSKSSQRATAPEAAQKKHAEKERAKRKASGKARKAGRGKK